MKYLNPVYFIKTLVNLIKDLVKFNRYLQITFDLEKSGELAKLKLRRTSMGKLYYVKNLQPEVLLAAEELPDFELLQVKESLAEYNEPIVNMGLIDYVKTGLQRIKTADVYAYLIWIEYDSKYIKASNFIYAALYLTALTFVSIQWCIPYLQ
jgi:hypothetical protein